MSGFLLDTKVLSELGKPRSHGAVVTWFESQPGGQIHLSAYGSAFLEWARIMQEKSDTLWDDAMIAATARENGLTVATRDEADFAALGAEFFNPFKA